MKTVRNLMIWFKVAALISFIAFVCVLMFVMDMIGQIVSAPFKAAYHSTVTFLNFLEDGRKHNNKD